MRARSGDGRTLLEVVHNGEDCVRWALYVTLPEPPDDVVLLKLGCWTLLFFRALFPDWKGAEDWIQDTAVSATRMVDGVEIELQNCRIHCRFNRDSHVLSYEVASGDWSSFPE